MNQNIPEQSSKNKKKLIKFLFRQILSRIPLEEHLKDLNYGYLEREMMVEKKQ